MSIVSLARRAAKRDAERWRWRQEEAGADSSEPDAGLVEALKKIAECDFRCEQKQPATYIEQMAFEMRRKAQAALRNHNREEA